MEDQSSVRKIILELSDGTCRCGQPKNRGNSFCRVCFYKLPQPMRQALYSRLRFTGNTPILTAGYGQAYEEAVRFLSEN
jgi:hypothetical protein